MQLQFATIAFSTSGAFLSHRIQMLSNTQWELRITLRNTTLFCSVSFESNRLIPGNHSECFNIHTYSNVIVSPGFSYMSQHVVGETARRPLRHREYFIMDITFINIIILS